MSTAEKAPSTSIAKAVNQSEPNEGTKSESPLPVKSDSVNGEAFYEDDLLIQQLFLFELEQLDETTMTTTTPTLVERNSPENEYDSEQDSLPPPLIPAESQPVPVLDVRPVETSNNNTKQKNLINVLGDECLESLIEGLALCQSSALAMVISNSGYPVELTLDDIQTPGDGLFLLLKALAKEPAKLIEPLFGYLAKLKRLSEPLLWFCADLFASDERVVKSFVGRGGIEVVSRGLAVTTRQLLYSGPCVVSSLMNFIDAERQNAKASQVSASSIKL